MQYNIFRGSAVRLNEMVGAVTKWLILSLSDFLELKWGPMEDDRAEAMSVSMDLS